MQNLGSTKLAKPLQAEVVKTNDFTEGVRKIIEGTGRGVPPIMELQGQGYEFFKKQLALYCPLLDICTVHSDLDLANIHFFGDPKTDYTTLYRSADGAVEWFPQSGTLSGPTVAQFTEADQSAYMVVAALRFSRKIITDYGKGLENSALKNFARLLGQSIQLAILYGAGSDSDPVTGLYNISGLTQTGYSSNVYNELVDGIKALRDAGVNVNAACISPREAATLWKTSGFDRGPIFIGDTPAVICNKIPIDIGGYAQSFALAGDFTSAVLMMPGGLRILKDPYTRFTQNDTQFVAQLWFGLSVESIADFRCLDLIT